MKKILCFGDSNTFGYEAGTGLRYSENIRWSGILKTLCTSKYDIIEAGCNNRTCFRDNFEGKIYTGYKILPDYLKSLPDIVVLAVGINDLQRIYNVSLEEVYYGIENLINITRKFVPKAHIILLCPAPIGKEVLSSKIFSFLFDQTSIEKSKSIADIYISAAKNCNCDAVDLSKLDIVSPIDGLHYTKEGHRIIAEKIYEKL